MSGTRCLTTAGLDHVLRLRRGAGAQGVRLTPSCHRAAGVDLTYLGAAVVVIHCHRCHQEVARLAVARGQPRGEGGMRAGGEDDG